MIRLGFMICLAVLAALPVAAQNVPIPARKQDILQPNTKVMTERQDRQRALVQKLATIDDEIESLRATMIRVARDVRAREREMTKLDDQISDLKQQRATLVKRLEQDYGDIAGLATALVRLRSIPPEAIMARPGAPLDTAQAAMILRRVVGPLQANAAALGRDLDRLATLETSLNERQQTLRLATRQIREEQTKLAELMRRREAAYTNLRADLVEQETQLAALARDAADFRDLIDKLERRNQELSAGSPSGLATPASIPPRLDIERRILRSLGDIQLPISGVIRVAYGATDEMGSASQGWRIEGRGGALVVAPMNGIIKYQGNFKNYGNMIIIEHAKNYHSLVAGLSKIDTVVGQSVEAGEPLGTLAAPRAERPAVYYELRQNGKPVNPSRLFADIG